MEQLYVFGTGNAVVTRCYNTCFALKDEGRYFMVDTGGGNGILGILEDMEVDIKDIHELFITHEHTDHLLGVIWMIRVIATRMRNNKYEGDLNIYCHQELKETITTICKLTLVDKLFCMIGQRIHLVPIHDGETVRIMDYDVTFFDIQSTKAKQFGFTLQLKNSKKLTCAGDEPYNPICDSYAAGSSWLLHEAFCLHSEQERFKPYEKHHSTVKDACELAERMQIDNLVLWHTEDKSLSTRKEQYTNEGTQYFHGNLLVPYDKEILDLI